MNKITLALLVSLSVLIPSASYAAPKEKAQVTQVKKKKIKKKKHAVKVEESRNPYLRCEGCTTVATGFTPVHYEASSEMTTAEFFRKFGSSPEPTVTVATKPVLTRDQKRQEVARACSWFTCGNDSHVVMEAKQWEGKTAKANRKELKALFANGKMPPIDPMRTPWCAAFANAILSRNGYETTNSLMARSFLQWGVKTKDPKEGDIVVLKRGRNNYLGHVGFFQGYEVIDGITYVKVLGGNTDHAVQVGYYPVDRVLGYRTAVA